MFYPKTSQITARVVSSTSPPALRSQTLPPVTKAAGLAADSSAIDFSENLPVKQITLKGIQFNEMNGGRQRSVGRGGAYHVLDYMNHMQSESPDFYYAVQGDQSNGNIFWADAAARINYCYFGDTVIFDTSYRVNQYKVPLVSFRGLNHHGQPVLFGCALLFDESDAAYVWLLDTWLHAMCNRKPVSITTEPDRFIQMATTQVLPETRHRYFKLSVFRETQQNLAPVCQSYPTFEAEFMNCINESRTVEEFAQRWESLLGQYYLMDNEWLQSIYNARHQWVPLFMRDTFFGELSPEVNDARNSFFDGFIDATTTLQTLIKQYEKAVADWQEKELQADEDTTNATPVLKTPSPMEKQAANLFTRRIFMKFQEELVETLCNPAMKIEESGSITTYRVAKFGEDHNAHIVNFNTVEIKANCSCQMFEFSGIICRHILAVFRAKNVLTLPSQYILKRWTRDARSGPAFDGPATEAPTNSRESLTFRYNNLRDEALKFVEEGAKSIYVYNVAIESLREAKREINAAKTPSSAAMHNGVLANGVVLHTDGQTQVTSGQSMDEKAKKIRELTEELESTNQRCGVYRFNLLSVLKDMEDQKLKLSVKVQNARLGLKE